MKYVEERFEGNIEEVNLLLLGDTHTGHPNYREDIVDEVLAEISNRQNGRIFLMGDLTEMALVNSVGDTYTQEMTPHEQIDYWVDKLKPYKDIIVGAIMSNHNERAIRTVGINPIKMIMQRLDIENKFYGYSVVIKWAFNKGTLHSYHFHGSTAAKTNAGIVRKIKKMREIVDVDMYFMAHTHRLISEDIDIIDFPDPRNMKLRTKRYYYINTGSALAWSGGYAEMKGYKKVMLGYPIVVMSGSKGHQTINVDKQVFLD